MADATRSHTAMQELERTLSQKINDATVELNQKYLESQTQFQTLTAAILEIQKNLQLQRMEQSNNDNSRQSPEEEEVQGGHNQRGSLYATRISKVEFPSFDGNHLKDWLYKCEQFFALDNTSPESKVRLASMHLHGNALQWHLNYMKSKFNIYPDWPQYISDISLRFGEIFVDPLAELIAVKQTGKVQDYVQAFELALTQVSLPAEHILSIFLAGLDHHIQMQVRMFNPTSMAHAANLARLYEASQTHNSSPMSTYRQFPTKISQPNTFLSPKNPTPQPTALSKHFTKPILDKPPKTYSAAEMADRRARGLCMFCDERFTPGHHLKHKKAQLFIIEGDEEEIDEEIMQSVVEDIPNLDPSTEFHLSVNAISGTATYQTMRVFGLHNKKLLHILIDSGSTHNFLDLELAKKLGCKLEAINPLTVAVANGTRMQSQFVCKGFSWQIQQVSFVSDVMLLPLGCCDLVLGVQWLSTLGPIIWDFDKLQMEFNYLGKRMVLRSARPSSVKLVNTKTFSQAVQQGGELCFLQVAIEERSVQESHQFLSCQLQPASVVPTAVTSLLAEFQDVFDEPKSLPPSRPGFDHRIPLKEGLTPVNQRPYRYSYSQKAIIDKLIEEIMNQGFIRHSNSPYASPVVLVGKKDGSWRLCVDYRQLNNQTVKDRFPIPLIDDLLDELGGSMI